MKRFMSMLIYKLYFEKSGNKDELQFIEKYLKRKGYDKYGNIFTKGFVIIEVKVSNKEIQSIEIFNDISKIKQQITVNFSSGLIVAENYYSRI
jgi:hypothetical protein